MTEENKNPKIRFKGFTDEWKKQKYSETFTNIPNNTLSRAKLNYNIGLAKNVHYGDILIKFEELLDVAKDEIPFIIDDALVYKFRASKLQNGDVIIADAAEDETVGKCTELVNVGEEIVVSGLHTIPVRPMLFFASGFLGYFMNSSAYHNQLLRLMQGIKVLSISKSAIKDTSIFSPIDTIEQSQIGTYFQNLDKLIYLHQRKYDKLVTIKKAMLTKMFPKNGADVPEIRFKRFTEAWEVGELGDGALKIGDGLHGTPQYVNNGGVYFINGNNLIYGTICINNETKQVSGNEQSKDDKSLNSNTILMSINGTIGNLAWYRGEKVMLGKSVAYITLENYDKTFVYAYLQTSIIHKNFRNKLTGSTIKNLGLKIIRETEVLIPKIKEQKKIGKYFKNLDHLITLHTRELEKIKNIKKACFEKMFA